MGFKVPIDMLDNLKKSISKSTAMIEDLHAGKKIKDSDIKKAIAENNRLVELVELNFDTNYDQG